MDGGMLSQDEINALLSGMEDGSIDPDKLQADAADTPEPLDSEPSVYENTAAISEEEALITDAEKDAIGEIANISMGSAATTLYSLVNRKVNITTPVVSLEQWETMIGEYERPCVFIQIKYTAGLDGHNILILKEHDVKIITDLMMGGDGTNTEGELSEIHLSAISEAMNQMMGASATSLATMLGKMIDISPPEATLIDLSTINAGHDISPFLGGTFVKIAFRMQIEDLIDSTIMQLYPCDFARFLCKAFMGDSLSAKSEPEPAPKPAPAASAPTLSEPMPSAPQPAQAPSASAPDMGMAGMGMPMMGMPGQDMNMAGMYSPYGMGMMPPGYGMPMQPMPQQAAPYMNVQPAQFQNFATGAPGGAAPANIDLIMDVALEVTVELGRTKKSISEVLDFAPGTIIELDKVAGEPVEVYVNGKMVARGEVVVIEESFGVRVTEIMK